MCSRHAEEGAGSEFVEPAKIYFCGQVFATNPFSASGELRFCSRQAGHDGEHDAEKEIRRLKRI